MKTIPLRQLLREPVKVKRLTRSGETVQVTDQGKPLWILQPAMPPEEEQRRAMEIDEILDDVLRAQPSRASAVDLLEKSRR